MSEFCILNQVGNMLYMTYAGVAPIVVGCGEHNFSDTMNQKENCLLLKEIQQHESCIPKLEAQFKSVNYEWGYYCSGTKIVRQFISTQMTGGIIGAGLFGIASDIFGRKLVILLAVIFCQVFMILSSFTNDLLWFTVCRTFVNVFNGGTFVIIVFVIENVPKRDRIWINNFVATVPNMMIFSLLAYFSGDWRTLTRASAALAIPAIIAICIISESPRFLIQRGRLNEAKRVIQRMCRIDGRNFDEAGLDRVLAEENQILLESKTKGRSFTCLFLLYFFYLFYTKKFAKYTIAIGFSLLVTSTMRYVLFFNMERFSDSIYWNAIFIAGIPYVMNMSIALLERYVKCVGRKMIHCGVLIFVEVWLVVMIFISYTGLGRFSLFSSIASLLIMGICSQLYILNKVVLMELLPTCLRPRSIVFVSESFISLGDDISLKILLLDFWRPLPYALMLILVVANQFLFHFTIPETKGQPLNDHMPGPEELIFRNICRKNTSRDEMILQDREAAQKLNENED